MRAAPALLVAATLLLAAAPAAATPPSDAAATPPAPAQTSDGSAPDPTQRHVRDRAILNGVGLGLLGGWGASSMVWGGAGLATTQPGSRPHAFHQMNFVWGATDLAIAGVAGIWIAAQTRHTGDTVAVLRGTHRLQVLYALNLGLDVGYVATGVLLEQLGAATGQLRLEGYGPSIALQGAVLLGLDLALLVGNAILQDRLLAERRTDWAASPPRRRRPLVGRFGRLQF